MVNTRESEVSPFIHPLYHVLYFSSRGQLLNFGDFDIYKTYRVRGRWQEPKNIGPLVNGRAKARSTTSPSTPKAKTCTTRAPKPHDLNNLDLYSFPLPMEAQPLATTHVEGTLLDSVIEQAAQGHREHHRHSTTALKWPASTSGPTARSTLS